LYSAFRSEDTEALGIWSFDTEYLQNGYRYGHSYYRRRIGNRTQAFEWH